MDLVEIVAREVKKHRGKACATLPLETCPEDGLGPCFCREEARSCVDALRSAGALREWSDAADAPTGKTVLIAWKNSQGKWRYAKAVKVAPKTMEASYETDWGEYDDETDTYWTPPGWYEDVEAETGMDYSLHWLGCEPLKFSLLPPPPEEGA